MNSTIELEETAKKMAGNWQRFTCFVWFEKQEDPQDWCIVYASNRDSGPLDRANAKAIDKAMQPFVDADVPDVHPESHGHWAVGYVDGYAIRVYRDGQITEAFTKWCGLQDQLDDYPVLDDGLYEKVQQQEIDESWETWVKYDFRRSLEKQFGREVRDDADLSQLFYESEPEWNEDSSGMYCDIDRCVKNIKPEDAEPYLVAA